MNAQTAARVGATGSRTPITSHNPKESRMSQPAPLTDEQLNDIDARHQAATQGPWGAYTFGGDTLIEIAADLEDTGTGYSARRGICRFDEEPLDNDPTHQEWTAEEDWAQVQADAEFIAHAPADVAALLAEVRRQRAELAQMRAARDVIASLHRDADGRLDAVAALCDREQRNAARWEHPLPVPEWVSAVRTAMQPPPAASSASVRPVPAPEAPDGPGSAQTGAGGRIEAAEDTLAAWLRQRFTATNVRWEDADTDDQSYWEHEARAVRRAVDRSGFKTVAINANEIELDGGDSMLQEMSVGDPIEITEQTGPLSPGTWVITAFETDDRCRASVRKLTREEIQAARRGEAFARTYE